MTEFCDLTGPVVRAATSLHGHRAGWLRREERKDLVPPQLPAEQHRSRCIGTVNLEHALRQIHPNRANLSHGRLPQVVLINTSTVAQRGRWGASTPSALVLSPIWRGVTTPIGAVNH